MRQLSAGDGDASLMLVRGYFDATLGTSSDLFGSLIEPICEQFDADDQVDTKLQEARSELVAQEIMR